MDVLCTFKFRIESQNSEHGCIKDQQPYPYQDQVAKPKSGKMPNPSQEPPASSKAPNEDLKDMDVLCTFRIRIESQILKNGVSKTSYHIQIKMKIPKTCQKPPASSKASHLDFKCIFEISFHL